MLNMLFDCKGFRIKDIKEHYEISSRQVSRDIEYLRTRFNGIDQGLDIIYDKRTKKYVFSEEDERKMNKWRTNVLYFLARKDMSLSSFAEDDLDSLFGKDLEYITVKSYAEENFSYKVFISLLTAARNGNRVRIAYPSGSVPERVIEPLQLVNYGEIWYLVATVKDDEEKKLLTFSLSRIKDVEILDEKITYADREKLERFLSSYGIYNSDDDKEYVIRFTGWAVKVVSNQVWQKDQKGRFMPDGSYELSFSSPSDVELLSRILFYGSAAEPIAPPDFVKKYWKSVEDMAKREKRGI